MILADSSIWIDHFRRSDPVLSRLLAERQVLAHPFVIGELALGSLHKRETILDALRSLPQAIVARDDEVQVFIDRHRLFGVGIGYVDAHLLAATVLTVGAKLWTRDRRLRAAGLNLLIVANLDQ